MDPGITPGCIVVGVDGSEHSHRAVVWAAEQAGLEGRPLVLLHGADRGFLHQAAWLDLEGVDPHEMRQVLQTAARSVLDDAAGLATTVHASLQPRIVLADADARDALVEASRVAHLVVLGSRGHGAFTSALLGSVSLAVATHARCPVVVSRPTEGPAWALRRGILVGADGTADSLPVVAFAFEMAAVRRLPLTVRYCYWDAHGALHDTAWDPETDPDVDDLRLLLAESVAGLAEKFPDVEVTLEPSRGLVDSCLVHGSSEKELVVVGLRHDTPFGRFLHPAIAVAVLERADTTVAVVRVPAERG